MSTKKIANHKAFDHVENWLYKSDKNYIKLIDKDDNIVIKYRDKITQRVKENWDKKALLERHKSIKDLFEVLLNKGHIQIEVHFKRSNGSSAVPHGDPIAILLEENTMLRNGSEKHAPSHNGAAFPIPYPNHNNMQHEIGALGAAANAVGLGFTDLVELKKTAELYNHLKGEYDKLLRKHDTESAEWHIERKRLTAKIQELEGKLSTAADRLELELKKKELEQKPAIQPEFWTQLAGSVPEILGSLKGHAPNPVPTAALSSAAKLSEAKEQLIEYVSSQEVTDEVANFMITVMYKLSTEQEFSKELQELLNKHTQHATS